MLNMKYHHEWTVLAMGQVGWRECDDNTVLYHNINTTIKEKLLQRTQGGSITLLPNLN